MLLAATPSRDCRLLVESQPLKGGMAGRSGVEPAAAAPLAFLFGSNGLEVTSLSRDRSRRKNDKVPNHQG